MLASDHDPEENQKKHKKYLWFGYGSYSGETGVFQPSNIRADPSIFDILFELFGVKEKPPKDNPENGTQK